MSIRSFVGIAAVVSVIVRIESLPQAQTHITPPKNSYTPEQDIELGQEAVAEVRKELPMLDDRRVDACVEEVGCDASKSGGKVGVRSEPVDAPEVLVPTFVVEHFTADESTTLERELRWIDDQTMVGTWQPELSVLYARFLAATPGLFRRVDKTSKRYTMRYLLLAESTGAAAIGEWARALRASEASLAMLRDRCVNVAWELTIAQNIVIWALMYLGEIGEVSRRVPAILADARRRGNLYLVTEVCTRSNYVWLAADDPDGGEREAAAAVAQWSSKAYHRQHYSAMLAQVQTALYRRDGDAAWRILEDHHTRLRRSLLTRAQAFRIEWCFLRARSALAIAAASGSWRFLSIARTYARRIAGERMPWSDPIALLLEAGIASTERRPSDAVRQLDEAVSRFDRAGMQLYAAVGRRRLGALRDDEQGRAARQQAEVWMAGQHIRNIPAMTRMLSPGLPD